MCPCIIRCGIIAVLLLHTYICRQPPAFFLLKGRVRRFFIHAVSVVAHFLLKQYTHLGIVYVGGYGCMSVHVGYHVARFVGEIRISDRGDCIV